MKKFKNGQTYYLVDFSNHSDHIYKISTINITRSNIYCYFYYGVYNEKRALVYLPLNKPHLCLVKNLNKAKRILELYKLGRYNR